jgi:hypothetical protein
MADARRPSDEQQAIAWLAFEGDFLRWFIERVRSGDHEPARRFVEAIEPLMTTSVKPSASDRVCNLARVCFSEGLVMNGDDDVIEAARPWMGPYTWEDVQHMYWYRSGKLPPTG